MSISARSLRRLAAVALGGALIVVFGIGLTPSGDSSDQARIGRPGGESSADGQINTI